MMITNKGRNNVILPLTSHDGGEGEWMGQQSRLPFCLLVSRTCCWTNDKRSQIFHEQCFKASGVAYRELEYRYAGQDFLCGARYLHATKVCSNWSMLLGLKTDRNTSDAKILSLAYRFCIICCITLLVNGLYLILSCVTNIVVFRGHYTVLLFSACGSSSIAVSQREITLL